MQKILICVVLLITTAVVQAQIKEEGFDFNFKPTKNIPRYWVITEKKDSLWHRQGFYLPERSIAMEGWYKDADCKMAHGTVTWYHPNRMIKSKREYADGKRHGLQLSFHDNGYVSDSAQYVAGRLKGVKLSWDKEVYQIDSMNFDGAGNGTQVTWYREGQVSSAGLWTADTVRKGRWNYYHVNGQVRATEDYVAGKRVALACYDDAGKPLKDCELVEAEYRGNWGSYLGRMLKADIPVKKGAPAGEYTVVVQFVVGTDGSLEGIEALTRFGFGMEEEVIRIVQQSPRWSPARMYGQKVKAYRRQPITFVVSH